MTEPVQPAPKRPQPVFTPQAVLAVVAFVVGQVVALAVIPAATGDAILSTAPAIVSAIFVVVPVVQALLAKRSAGKVTPISDPRRAVDIGTGQIVLEPLVPVSQTRQQAVSVADTVGISDHVSAVLTPEPFDFSKPVGPESPYWMPPIEGTPAHGDLPPLT